MSTQRVGTVSKQPTEELEAVLEVKICMAGHAFLNVGKKKKKKKRKCSIKHTDVWAIPVTVKLDDGAWLTPRGEVRPSWDDWGIFFQGAIDDIQNVYAGYIENKSTKRIGFKTIDSVAKTKTWLPKVLDLKLIYDRLGGVREVCNKTGGHEPAATVLAWRLYAEDSLESPWVNEKRLNYAEDSTRTDRKNARIAHRNAVMSAMKEAARKLLYAANDAPDDVVARSLQHTQAWLLDLFNTPITKKIVYNGAGVSSNALDKFLRQPSTKTHFLVSFLVRSWTDPSSVSIAVLQDLPSATRLMLLNKARLEALQVAPRPSITAFHWAGAIRDGWFNGVPVLGVSKEDDDDLPTGDYPSWVLGVNALAYILAIGCDCERAPHGSDNGLYLLAVATPHVADRSLPDGEQAFPYSIGPAVSADPSLSSPWLAEKALTGLTIPKNLFTGKKIRKMLLLIKKALMGAGVFLYVGKSSATTRPLETRVLQHFTGGSTSSCLDTLLLAQDRVLPPSSFCVCYFSLDSEQESETIEWLIDNGLGWLLLNVASGDS